MKKSILFIAVVFLGSSFTAIHFFKPVDSICAPVAESSSSDPIELENKNDLDIFYSVKPRFIHTVTKEQLSKAKTIFDLLPQNAYRQIDFYKSVVVSSFGEDQNIAEIGVNELLNKQQIQLIRSFDYSNDFYIKADYQNQNFITGHVGDDHLIYYITVVPERMAEYKDGQEQLIQTLKDKTAHLLPLINKDRLQPGKVAFTVSNSGIIKNIRLLSSCGYHTIDEQLKTIINDLPGEWYTATDNSGKPVDQELIFSFGQEGC